jgi:cobalamin biosynthetic protein CobC
LIEHGGRLRQAAAKYGIPLNEWLDLSTGINPNGWPVPEVPPDMWARLPEEDDGLEAAACAYYKTDSLLPVAGSQAAIQALPRLRQPCRVGVIHPGYAEHRHHWKRAGHAVTPLAPNAIERQIPDLDVLVLINPNNPTGDRFDVETLLHWHERLAARGGWLVVDEAFMDPTPEQSLAGKTRRPGLIVLRSLGKFFGLTGARVGFVLAEPTLLERMATELGPWTVTGPSRFMTQQALSDQPWQNEARLRIPQESQRLAELLSRHGLTPSGGTTLFQWVCSPRAHAIHEALARQGILTRLFTEPPSLRFGLPGDENDWV